MKYPTDRGVIGVIRVDQRAARMCYEGSLKNKKRCWQIKREVRIDDEIEIEQRVDYEGERPQPTGGIQIDSNK